MKKLLLIIITSLSSTIFCGGEKYFPRTAQNYTNGQLSTQHRFMQKPLINNFSLKNKRATLNVQIESNEPILPLALPTRNQQTSTRQTRTYSQTSSHSIKPLIVPYALLASVALVFLNKHLVYALETGHYNSYQNNSLIGLNCSDPVFYKECSELINQAAINNEFTPESIRASEQMQQSYPKLCQLECYEDDASESCIKCACTEICKSTNLQELCAICKKANIIEKKPRLPLCKKECGPTSTVTQCFKCMCQEKYAEDFETCFNDACSEFCENNNHPVMCYVCNEIARIAFTTDLKQEKI